MSGLVIEGLSPDGDYVYFWWHGVEGDAKVEDGKVVDVQICDPRVFELPPLVELKVAISIGEWLERHQTAN